MQKTLTITLLAFFFCGQLAFAAENLADRPATGFKYKDKDPYTLIGDKTTFATLPTFDKEGLIHTLITMPTGTSAVWEFSPATGNITREIKEGKPYFLPYLGYPGNIGVILNTKEPLEVLVLGDPLSRGSVAKAKVIGALKVADAQGSEAYKIIAAHESSPLYSASGVSDLINNFPGATSILEIWFVNRNGKEKSRSLGYIEADKALELFGK